EFLGNAFGDRARCETPRLRVADGRVTEFEADFWKLRGFTRPGRTRNDHDLVVANGVSNVIPPLADRQIRRVGDGNGSGNHEPSILRLIALRCLCRESRVLLADGVTGWNDSESEEQPCQSLPGPSWCRFPTRRLRNNSRSI